MRKSKPKKRILLPDPKFNDVLVTRFVNNMMFDGKKSTAYAIFYNAVEIVEKKTNESGLDTWKKALNNVMPAVEVKSRRVGGANFQVPTEVRPERKVALGMKWLISYARRRGEKTMMEKLGIPQTHLGLKEMIKQVDEDQDGKISFREVKKNFF